MVCHFHSQEIATVALRVLSWSLLRIFLILLPIMHKSEIIARFLVLECELSDEILLCISSQVHLLEHLKFFIIISCLT